MSFSSPSKKTTEILMSNEEKQMKNDIEMLQKLRHRNIIRLYEEIDDEKYQDYYILLMELAQGGSLFNFI